MRWATVLLGRVYLLRLLVIVVAVAGVSNVSAEAREPGIAAMRERDRLAPPAEELAAWETFAAPMMADPATDGGLRAEVLLGLAIARYYARDREQGWADLLAAEALHDAAAQPAPFHAELLAYASLTALELGEVETARSYAERARAMADAQGAGAERLQALARNAHPGGAGSLPPRAKV